MKCINCKHAMTPKKQSIGLSFICTNVKQSKGLVKANFECVKGIG